MTKEITKPVFDDWWTSTYLLCIEGLLPQQIEALVDFHWRELQATAIRHSLREQAKEDKENCVPITVVCDTHVGGHEDPPCTCESTLASVRNLHLKDCPLYQVSR